MARRACERFRPARTQPRRTGPPVRPRQRGVLRATGFAFSVAHIQFPPPLHPPSPGRRRPDPGNLLPGLARAAPLQPRALLRALALCHRPPHRRQPFSLRGAHSTNFRPTPASWRKTRPASLPPRTTPTPLWRMARALKPRHWEVLWFRYGEGFSIAETARAMRTNEIHVKVLLHRARAALAKRLAARGYGPAGGSEAAAIGNPNRSGIRNHERPFMIKCWYYRRIISRSADEDAPLPPAAQAHIAQCPECRRVFATEHEIVRRLSAPRRRAKGGAASALSPRQNHGPESPPRQSGRPPRRPILPPPPARRPGYRVRSSLTIILLRPRPQAGSRPNRRHPRRRTRAAPAASQEPARPSRR